MLTAGSIIAIISWIILIGMWVLGAFLTFILICILVYMYKTIWRKRKSKKGEDNHEL